jgi:CoA-dependent NAD(P)H sulfur oxidoreductase
VVPGIEPSLAKLVREEFDRQGVRVETGVGLRGITRDDHQLVVDTDRGAFAADMVLVSVGVRPNVALAKEAGIRIGPTGAIAVDAELCTSAPGVYAAGDCAEAVQLVTGESTWVPLGTTANKQGKIAGANATGAHERFEGIVGTAAFKVFDLEVGRTGLGRVELEKKGIDFIVSTSKHATRGHHYPGVKSVTTVLFVQRGNGKLLGAQMVGGEGVAGRIDVLATALHAKMTLDDLAALDLAYAPPLAPVWDPLLIAASSAQKDLRKAT